MELIKIISYPIFAGGILVICHEQFILNEYLSSMFLLIIGYIFFYKGIETHEKLSEKMKNIKEK